MQSSPWLQKVTELQQDYRNQMNNINIQIGLLLATAFEEYNSDRRAKHFRWFFLHSIVAFAFKRVIRRRVSLKWHYHYKFGYYIVTVQLYWLYVSLRLTLD